MNVPPPSLTDAILRDAVARHWSFTADRLTYLKVGHGSHHWLAEDSAGAGLFLTVHDLGRPFFGVRALPKFERLGRAFAVAAALRAGGLDFVVAPLPAQDGTVLQPLGGEFSIAAFPPVDGVIHEARVTADLPAMERRAILACVEALHGATPSVAGIADREDFPPPGGLDEVLGSLDQPWSAGPYSRRAHELVRAREADLAAALAIHDELAERVRRCDEPWVVTHGEPTAGNLMWTANGPVLVDWETVIIGPAGRDLWMLNPPHPDEDPGRTLYRLAWELTGIGIHANELRRPHEETGNARSSWRMVREFGRPDAFHALLSRDGNRAAG